MSTEVFSLDRCLEITIILFLVLHYIFVLKCVLLDINCILSSDIIYQEK